jgi:hypothetical protein
MGERRRELNRSTVTGLASCDSLDDLAAVDPLQADRSDPKLRVP